jgi:hypothetical protein
MHEGKTYMVFASYALVLSGAILSAVSIGLDTFIELKYTPFGATEDVVDRFGIWTWNVDHEVGMYTGSHTTMYAVSCYENSPSLDGSEKPNAGCAAECGTKKGLSVVMVALAFFAIFLLMDFKEGSYTHFWIHREAPGIRTASIISAGLSCVFGVIVLAFFAHEREQKSHLVGSGTSQVYSEKIGVCAYGLSTTDQNTVLSYENPQFGDAYWILVAGTVSIGLGFASGLGVITHVIE